ncbi:hypothetical protein JCM11641_005952 [Rhodosporidiobolus odoratus]
MSASTFTPPYSAISGPTYLSSLARFIRTHEHALANYYAPRPSTTRHKPPPPGWTTVLTLGIVPTAESSSSPTPSPTPIPPRKDPLVLKFDPHHLYYLLLKFDELGIAGAGELDVRVEGGTSRPMSVDYSALLPPATEQGNGSILGGMFGLSGKSGKKDDDALSVRSGMSSFSFGSGWWGLGGAATNEQQEDEATNVRYIYSSCTKLPALKLSPFCLAAPTGVGAKDTTPPLVRVVEGFEDCPPPDTCVPLLAFKNLSSLVLEDLDPRGFLGWDVLSVQLRSLEVRRGGLEDIGELICDAPVEDSARRVATGRRDRAVGYERRWRAEGSASSVEARVEPGREPPSPTTAAYPTPSKLAWSSLRHLSLSDNSLTFIPSPPLTFLPTLTSLDLSSNLLISIPTGLSHLTSLRSLNLSDNMIDSLLGVASALGAIEVLNLSQNRLENLSGLDRLPVLERLDVRENRLQEALEVSRVARLPHLREVWVRGNPFSRTKEEGGEEGWRAKVFGYFAEEDSHGHRDFTAREIRIDGSGMSSSERRAVEAERSRRGTPLGRRRASTGAAERLAEMRGGEAKVVGRRVVTAPHRHHHHDHSHRPASPPPPVPPLPTLSAADCSPSSSRPTSPSPAHLKSPAKPKRRKPRRIVDLDADPSSSAHPATASSSGVGRYSDSDPTSSGAETSRTRLNPGRVHRPSTVAEEPLSAPTTDDGLSSSPRLQASFAKHQRHASSPSTGTRQGGSSSLTSSPSKGLSRRDRISASTYEYPTTTHGAGREGIESSGEAYRRKIEQLRDQVGDSYLAVWGEREAMAARNKGKQSTATIGQAEELSALEPEARQKRPGEEAGGDEVKAGEGGEGEQAAVAPAMKEGVKVVKKKKVKGKKKK